MTGLADRRARAARHLNEYTDPTGLYAFGTYDRLYGSEAALTPGDVLLANLMSLRLGWRDVVPLFAEGQGHPQTLRKALDRALTDLAQAPAFEDHGSLNDLEASLRSLAKANEATQYVAGWTAVTVSKVLHRRRPHVVPVIDSRVRAFYKVSRPATLRAAMWQDIRDNESWLRALAAEYQTPDGRPLSTLRCADILIWMGH